MKGFVSRIGWPGLCSLAAAVIVAAAMTSTLVPLSNEMPHWDQWYVTPIFAAHHAGQPVLPLLLEPYNGHYNWLPRSLFYAVGLLTRWNLRVEVSMGFFWAACTLALLLRMLWEASPRLLILATPFAALVFSTLQFANFLNGFGMGQLLGTFAVVLSIYLLTDPRAGNRRFALALVSAAAAFISHGAALALIPAGSAAVLLVGSRRNWRRIAIWSLVASIGIGLGALGGRSIHRVVSWSRLPEFALTLLGRPFALDVVPSLRGTMYAGAAVMAALILVIALRVTREWYAKRDLLVRWACLGITAPVVAVLIAISKSRAPTDLALSTHYVTSTYVLGLALLVLVADALCDAMSRARGAKRALLALALLACCAAPVIQQAVAAYHVIPVLRSWRVIDVQVARRLAARTATDQDILTAVNSEVDFTRSSVEVLRTRHLAWFAHAREARRPFGDLDSVAGRSPAAIVEVRRGEPWVFEGWAVPPLSALQTPTEAVLVIDGATVAAVRPDRPRPDRAAYFGSSSFLSCGFVLVAPDGARRPPGRYAVRIALRTPKRTTTLRTLELAVAP